MPRPKPEIILSAELKTTISPLAAYFDKPFTKESSGPVVFMIHGAMRNATHLWEWFEHLPPHLDLVIVELPGHGKAPTQGPFTIDSFAQRIVDVITHHFAGRDIVVVGESLGGLVALALAGRGLPRIKGALATDPPMSMMKQWPVYVTFMMHNERMAPNDPKRTMFSDLFGFVDDTNVHEVLYYDLVRAAACPTLILVGDVPLFPGWPLAPRKYNPSVFDDVDRYVLSLIGNAHVRLDTIHDAGHVLLSLPKPQLLDAVLGFCSDVLNPAPATPAPLPDRLVWR